MAEAEQGAVPSEDGDGASQVPSSSGIRQWAAHLDLEPPSVASLPYPLSAETQRY